MVTVNSMHLDLASDEVALDPIRFEVIRNALTAVADEMALALQRTAYSTNIKTRLDFSCAIFDAEAQLVAQSFGQPNHLGSLTHFVPLILERFGPDRIRSGDGIVCNDGHRGGVHLNDVCLLAPVFVGGRVAGYVATLAHHLDVGGGTAGSIGISREIYQEGLIIPPTRLLIDGRIDESVLQFILANVRAPKETGGDFRAQVAGVMIGIRGIERIITKHGIDTFAMTIKELLDYTERRAIAELANIPKGVYEAEGFMDSDGITDDPIRIATKITVSDRKVVFDLSGSDPQRAGSLNATYAMTLSNCAYPLRVLMDPDLPTNAGFYRVIEIIAPLGSVVNARPPAAIASGWEAAFRVCEVNIRAFANVMPERLTAGSKGCLCNIAFGGINPRNGEYFVFYEAMAGGYGARATKDGMDAIQPHVQNTENSPAEETEANYPVQILRYSLISDSEGAGRQRGGVGLRRDYAFEGEVAFNVFADKAKFAPEGLVGGQSARPAKYVRNPESRPEDYPSKLSIRLSPGEVFSVQMGGGGGYGSPLERDPGRVLRDVLDGKVSRNRARDTYGVVFTERGDDVDADGTRTARDDLHRKPLELSR